MTTRKHPLNRLKHDNTIGLDVIAAIEHNMPISRRNTIVGLGAVVAGGGLVLGTGAFTQVEAQRTVSVDTAGDADAMLGLEAHEDYDVGDDIIQLEIEDLSLEAETIVATPTLVISNNGSQDVDSIEFEFEIDSETIDVVELGEVGDGGVGAAFEFVSAHEFSEGDGFGAEEGSTVSDEPSESPLGVGDSAAYRLIIDTHGSGLDADSEFDLDVTITVQAEDA